MFNLWVIIGFLIKLIVVFGVVRWWLYRSRDTHAGRLARLICLAFIGVAILPLGAITLPVITMEVVPHRLWALMNVDVQQDIPALLIIMAVLYLSGVFAILCFRFWHLLSALEYIVKAQVAPEHTQNVLNDLTSKIHLNKHVSIKITPCPTSAGDTSTAGNVASENGPFTVGFINPVIVLPSNYEFWSESTLKRVLTHELTHIARHDWLWQNILQCLTAFVWFLPSAWRLNKKFTWLSELNADDAVLQFDDNRAAYAKDLLTIATQAQSTPISATALIDGSYCYERIAAVLDGSRLRAKKPLKSTQFWTWIIACLAWLVISALAIEAKALALSSYNDDHHSFIYVVNLEPKIIPVDEALLGVIPGRVDEYPAEIVETLAIIERDVAVTKRQLAQGLRSELGQLASANLKALAPLPNVKIHGYIAVRAAIPEYPKNARRKNIEGQVIVQFDVLSTGRPDNIRIAMATPKKVFEKSVLEAMDRSIFRPAMANGRPVKTAHATQTFTFRLFEGAKPKTINPPFGTPIKTAAAEQTTQTAQ